ncbi:MAG: hypothetical protein U0892_18415 [Pirellulales bacterium]
MLDEAPKQKLAPPVSMIWFFVLITCFAILLVVIQVADQGGAALKAFLALGAWVVLLMIIYAGHFLLAFVFGWLERLVEPPASVSQSPFAEDALPQQFVQPLRADDK